MAGEDRKLIFSTEFKGTGLLEVTRMIEQLGRKVQDLSRSVAGLNFTGSGKGMDALQKAVASSEKALKGMETAYKTTMDTFQQHGGRALSAQAKLIQGATSDLQEFVDMYKQASGAARDFQSASGQGSKVLYGPNGQPVLTIPGARVGGGGAMPPGFNPGAINPGSPPGGGPPAVALSGGGFGGMSMSGMLGAAAIGSAIAGAVSGALKGYQQTKTTDIANVAAVNAFNKELVSAANSGDMRNSWFMMSKFRGYDPTLFGNQGNNTNLRAGADILRDAGGTRANAWSRGLDLGAMPLDIASQTLTGGLGGLRGSIQGGYNSVFDTFHGGVDRENVQKMMEAMSAGRNAINAGEDSAMQDISQNAMLRQSVARRLGGSPTGFFNAGRGYHFNESQSYAAAGGLEQLIGGRRTGKLSSALFGAMGANMSPAVAASVLANLSFGGGNAGQQLGGLMNFSNRFGVNNKTDIRLQEEFAQIAGGAAFGEGGRNANADVFGKKFIGAAGPGADMFAIQNTKTGMDAYNNTIHGGGIFEAQRYMLAKRILGPGATTNQILALSQASTQELVSGGSERLKALGLNKDQQLNMFRLESAEPLGLYNKDAASSLRRVMGGGKALTGDERTNIIETMRRMPGMDSHEAAKKNLDFMLAGGARLPNVGGQMPSGTGDPNSITQIDEMNAAQMLDINTGRDKGFQTKLKASAALTLEGKIAGSEKPLTVNGSKETVGAQAADTAESMSRLAEELRKTTAEAGHLAGALGSVRSGSAAGSRIGTSEDVE